MTGLEFCSLYIFVAKCNLHSPDWDKEAVCVKMACKVVQKIFTSLIKEKSLSYWVFQSSLVSLLQLSIFNCLKGLFSLRQLHSSLSLMPRSGKNTCNATSFTSFKCQYKTHFFLWSFQHNVLDSLPYWSLSTCNQNEYIFFPSSALPPLSSLPFAAFLMPNFRW